jgi:hypothetical protein
MTFEEAMGLLQGLDRHQVRAYVARHLSARQAARFEERTRKSTSADVIRLAAAHALTRERPPRARADRPSSAPSSAPSSKRTRSR